MGHSSRHNRVSEGQIYYHVQHGRGVDRDERVLEIGIFSSLKTAREVVANLKKKPGFRMKGGKFWISRGKIGQVAWSEGYVDMAESLRDLEKGKILRAAAGKDGNLGSKR